LRRLICAGRRAIGGAMALAAAALLVRAHQPALAHVLGLVAIALGLWSCHALRLAARSRVGAESEAQVRGALEPLKLNGWRVEHAVNWPRGGDLDHIVRAPSGIGFVIETKTRRYTRAHLRRTADAARRLARKRRRYPRGVRPVICLTRAARVARVEGTVLIVSADVLMPTLRGAAATASRRKRRPGLPSARARTLFG
jgi:hypothetical protein